MYRGTGAPVCVNTGTEQTVNLPRPLKGKRKEEYKIETKTFTNIFGKRIIGKTRYRFIGDYEFGKVSQNVIDNMASFLNDSTTIKWIPHSDFPFVNYHVRVIECNPEYFGGNIYVDTLKVKVESVDYVYEIPTIDNMLAGVRKNCRMAVMSQS